MLAKLFFGDTVLDFAELQSNSNFFKSRFIIFLNPLILLLAYYFYSRKKIGTTCLIFIIYGLMCLGLDARSNSVVFLISGALLLIKASGVKLTLLKITVPCLLLLGCFYLGYMFYVDSVLDGDFGGANSQVQLALVSNRYNPFELLYYGRSEFVTLIAAGLDSPLFGHGSWAKDVDGKYALLTAALIGSDVIGEDGFIRAHSIVMGYFAYAGIFGLLSVSFLFLKLFGFAIKLYKSEYFIASLPIITALSIEMLWTFFFSPIGHLRSSFPLFASLIIVEYTRLPKYPMLNNTKERMLNRIQ
tara:strand:- start:2413 stop:3315 length:903 start_codon:yes stop_codon:yes gene_type:complete